MAPKKGKEKPVKKKSGGTSKIVVLMILAALIPFSLPTVVLLFFALLPTLGAWASERGQDKFGWLCVGGLNFAGVIPYLFTLWFGVHTLEESLNMLQNSSVLFWSYAASGAGWLIYMIVPPVVVSWLNFSTNRRISALGAAQKKLIEDWGSDVAHKSND